ncbi:hypothetical protein E3T43_00580 [Cryobacterium sp. Hh7]|nr:hypothetical protein [Cryobacterium sp. Hh7]TFD61928.1 hypothetical protein E3T43_00580 [Cryobacterium sp. Hh7]
MIGNEVPPLPVCFPCGLPEDSRSDWAFLAGLLKLSVLGGLEEFVEFLSSRERNEAFSSSRRSTRFSS